jgi:predicted PurR-regulated permease PerM
MAFFITKPFLSAFFTGALVAYLSYPLYNKSLKYIKNRNLASFILSIFIVLLITIPSIFIIGMVSKEAISTLKALNPNSSIIPLDSGTRATDPALGGQNLGSNFMRIACDNGEGFLCSSLERVTDYLPGHNFDNVIKMIVEKITAFIARNAYGFISSIPEIALNFFVMIFVVYYMLKDGPWIAEKIKSIIPLKTKHKEQVVNRFMDVTSEVFYANLMVAGLQGLLGTVGLFLLGAPSPLLWGAVMTVFALIPYFGTAIVWLPLSLNMLFSGYLSSDQSLVWKGIILIAYGIIVISTADNILKPKLIGHKAHIHPVLVLLGVLGGLQLFGFVGIILGPLMLALLVTFIDIYEAERQEL